jgi:hypothetical protein
VKAAIVLGNCDIVDAGFAAAHQAALVEFPLLAAPCRVDGRLPVGQ